MGKFEVWLHLALFDEYETLGTRGRRLLKDVFGYQVDKDRVMTVKLDCQLDDS